MLNRLIKNIHKVLGIILSTLFLMWFISGIVMIYHSFPRISPKIQLASQKVLSGNLPGIDTLLSVVPDSARLDGLSVNMYLDRPAFHLKGRQVPSDVYADSLRVVEPPDFNTVKRIAEQLGGLSACRVDTLNELDQWIPFSYLRKEFPIYKFVFADKRHTEIYIASATGRVLQMTVRNSRAWAWVGAIPHWVYFTSLRENQPLWIGFVKWTSGLGAIMCITGLWVGVWAYWRNRRKGFCSPYKKWWYRWHHISGMIFGLFALTFVFSGFMSLADLPDWMKKGKPAESRRHFRGRDGGMLAADAYRLDYRQMVAAIKDVKSVEWSSFGRSPYYIVQTDAGKQYIDAAVGDSILPFRLTEEMIRQAVRRIHGDSVKYSLEMIDKFDKDYFSRRGMLTLPAYRVILEDELHTRHYFNPKTLYHSQIDDNGRVKGFLYGGLHSLNFKYLADHPVMWNVVMYVLLIGGTFLSLTGVVLTIKWLCRIVKRLKNRLF